MPSDPSTVRARYADRRASGRCIGCGAPSTASRCAPCAAHKATLARESTAARRARGACTRCPLPAVEGGVLCDGCLAASRADGKLRAGAREAAIREERAIAHVAYADKPHGWERTTVAVYPPSPRGDELLRLRLDHPTITRREVARALGLAPCGHSALENGTATLSDEEWEAALRIVRELAGKEPSRG